MIRRFRYWLIRKLAGHDTVVGNMDFPAWEPVNPFILKDDGVYFWGCSFHAKT